MANKKSSKRAKGAASHKPVAVACTRLLGDWIPCSKELPRSSKEVLCHCEDGIIKIMWRDDFKTLWMWTDGEGPHMDKDEVTHWMPLPNPPNPGLQGTGHLVDRTLQGVVGERMQ